MDAEHPASKPPRFTPVTSTATVGAMRLEVSGCSHIGNTRATNQDAWAVMPLPAAGALALLLADGMGGHEGGALAAEAALAATAGYLSAAGPDIDLRAAVAAANAGVHTELAARGLRGGGTTLVIAVITESRVDVANVGDSRAYIVRNGLADQVTKDHSALQEWLDAESPAWTPPPPRHLLTRALQGHPVDPHVVSVDVRLRHGDRVVVCSDGAWEFLPPGQFVAHAGGNRPSSVESGVVAAVRAALDQGSPDNVTVVAAGHPTERRGRRDLSTRRAIAGPI